MRKSQDYNRFLQNLVKQYESEGFSVVKEPRSSDLPDKLKGFSPDLLARRGRERVAIEVKTPGQKSPTAKVQALWSMVEANDNWRLDVVLYVPESGNVERVASPSTIKRAINEAKRLFGSNQKAAGLLLAWSALEASAKRAIRTQAGELIRSRSAHELLKNLVFNGLIEESDLNVLGRIAERRNNLAHGDLSQRVPLREFERVCELSERLLNPTALEVT